MNVAAPIEVGSTGREGPSRGQPHTETRVNLQSWLDTGSAETHSTAQPAAASFRSSWEWQLASSDNGPHRRAAADAGLDSADLSVRSVEARAPSPFDLAPNGPFVPLAPRALSPFFNRESSLRKESGPAAQKASQSVKTIQAQFPTLSTARSSARQTAIAVANNSTKTDPLPSARAQSGAPSKRATCDSNPGANDSEMTTSTRNPSSLNELPTVVAATAEAPSSSFGRRNSLSSNRSGHSAIDSLEFESTAPAADLAAGDAASTHSRLQNRGNKPDLALNLHERMTPQLKTPLRGRPLDSALVDSSSRANEADSSLSALSIAAPIQSAKAAAGEVKRSSEQAVTRHPLRSEPLKSAPRANPLTESLTSVPSTNAAAVVGGLSAVLKTSSTIASSIGWPADAGSETRLSSSPSGRSYDVASTTPGKRPAGNQQGTAATKTSIVNSDEADQFSFGSPQAPGNSEEVSASAPAHFHSGAGQNESIQNQIEVQKPSGSLPSVKVPVSDFPEPVTGIANAADPDGTPVNVQLPMAANLEAAAIKSSAQVAPRVFQRAAKIGQKEIRLDTAQMRAGVPAPGPAAAAPLTRDPGAQPGATSQTRDNSTASTLPASSVALSGTFASLDAGIDHASPNWIHTGIQRAEAGFQDPSLGWVGVRADVGSGGVHATVMPGTSDAAQALGGHLAGLNAYLAAEHTSVASVTLASPKDSEERTSGNQDMSQGTGQNPGDQAPPQSQENTQPHNQHQVSLSAVDTPELRAPAPGPVPFAEVPRPEGSSFSVLA